MSLERRIGLRVDEEDYIKYQEAAELNGCSLSEYLRALIEDGYLLSTKEVKQ